MMIALGASRLTRMAAASRPYNRVAARLTSTICAFCQLLAPAASRERLAQVEACGLIEGPPSKAPQDAPRLMALSCGPKKGHHSVGYGPLRGNQKKPRANGTRTGQARSGWGQELSALVDRKHVLAPNQSANSAPSPAAYASERLTWPLDE